MEYFKEASISNWSNIQSYCLSLLVQQSQDAIVLTDSALAFIQESLQIDMPNTTVKSAIMFINEAHFKQDMHVDGFNPRRINASNTALNIPILNCEGGEMYWYVGKYTLSTTDLNGLGYLQINWQTVPRLAAKKIINSPTIVRINVPHHIINNSDQPRIMLSVRFADDIPLVSNT